MNRKSASVDLVYEKESYAIRGAVFEVYREMGCGFHESVYQECLEKELRLRNVPFAAQKELRLTYKGEPLQQTYKPDLICYGCIIVELKALSALTGEHRAQVINYLKATGLQLGLLVNFGCHPKAAVERIVFGEGPQKQASVLSASSVDRTGDGGSTESAEDTERSDQL